MSALTLFTIYANDFIRAISVANGGYSPAGRNFQFFTNGTPETFDGFHKTVTHFATPSQSKRLLNTGMTCVRMQFTDQGFPTLGSEFFTGMRNGISLSAIFWERWIKSYIFFFKFLIFIS